MSPSEVTIITPTIPGREKMLEECVQSVKDQVGGPFKHLIYEDAGLEGCWYALNQLLDEVETPWLHMLGDDDLLDPEHVRTLLGAEQLSGDAPPFKADIIYSYCRVEGRPGFNPNKPFAENPDLYIPATAMIRTDLVRELGGWRQSPHWEDHDFWIRARAHGAVFKCVQRITWTYRFHGSNSSWRENG